MRHHDFCAPDYSWRCASRVLSQRGASRKHLDWSIRISGGGLPDRNRGNSGARINAHTQRGLTRRSSKPCLAVTVSPAACTIASSPCCAPLTSRRLPLLPALLHDPSSTATASNSTDRSASSAVALTSDGLPCTSNSAMNELPNRSMQPTARVYVSFLC